MNRFNLDQIEMRPFTTLSLLISILLVLKCGQITSSQDDSKFLFSLTVKDSSNQPLSGLSVSAWNKIKIITGREKPNYPTSYAASTTITFDLFDDAQVDLAVKNLRNEPILNIFEKTFLYPGKYSVAPSIQSNDALAIYKCLLEVRDVKQHHLFFKDSTYMVLYQPSILSNQLGVTNSQGQYSNRDSLKFPSVLTKLPELVYTDYFSPERRGEIGIEDSIIIMVWDPQTFLLQEYFKKIQPGKNHFELVWDPYPSNPPLKTFLNPMTNQSEHFFKHEDIKIFQWKLYQNYPNPFN